MLADLASGKLQTLQWVMSNSAGACAGVPCFLVNAALAGWIKWSGYESPAVTISVLLGCGLVYLVSSSGTWIRHLVAPSATDNYLVSSGIGREVHARQLPQADGSQMPARAIEEACIDVGCWLLCGTCMAVAQESVRPGVQAVIQACLRCTFAWQLVRTWRGCSC